MNPLTLDNVNWQDFYLTDFFRLEKGNQNNMAILQDGNLPLVSAKKTDNGYKQFIAPNGKRLYDGNILTLNNDGDGGAGIAYYQPFQMALDSHCTALIPKKEMSRFQMLFIALCITKQRDRFGHGYSLNNSRLRSFKFMLPVNTDNQPDWDFMEAYMRQQEKQILQPTIKQLCNQLIYNELAGGGKIHLANLNWKEFYFTEVFTDIQRGKRLKKADHQDGNTPYVSSTSQDNGVDGFIGNESGVRIFDDCLTVANSGSVGSAFYHKYQFVASDHVTQLKRDGLDKYAYLFMIPLINRLSEKYSFNREINDERIKREKIILPADANGNPDFAFMSSFMQSVESDILSTTLRYFADKQQITPPPPPPIANKSINWQNFLLRDIFPLLEAGKSKGLNHLRRQKNGISYLGATNLNNAVLDYVEPVPELIQKGNCIAFIRNGEGSMGYAVYKEEDFIATSDISVGYNPNLNKYNGMFITTIADRIRGKYNFGYKRSAQRLAKEILTLPATPDNQPDWEYMETYMRTLESQQLVNVLNYYIKCG
ncbi:MAG: hypothetical protein E7070_06520 [Bacteroidales bacterium]|nr:hypothetical protein [Bacteroidales bacterium]